LICRKELKENAKAVLKRFGYWNVFAVTLISGFLAEGIGSSAMSGVSSMFSSIISAVFETSSDSPSYSETMETVFGNPIFTAWFVIILTAVILITFALALCFGVFVSGPVLAGKNRFFMENRLYGSKFERLFWGFGKGRYLPIAKTTFVYMIRIFLWSLLFLIPGIIKSYEYFMVMYILSENPEIGAERAFEISSRTTKGEKWKIFLFELSFLGWILLGLLSCGIGVYFLEPYYYASFVELYQKLREKAISEGIADCSELPGYIRN